MRAPRLSQWQPGRHLPLWRRWVVLLSCALCLASCDPGGDSGTPPAAPAPTDPQFVPHGVLAVLDLYRTAVLQEDIDRLQALLQVADTRDLSGGLRPQRHEEAAFADGATFREAMTAAFRTLTVTALQIPPETIQVAADGAHVTFHEVESVEDPAALVQQTRLYRTTWRLAREEAAGVVTFRIAAVRREGPLSVVTTPGQVLAGVPLRLSVGSAGATEPPVAVTAEVPETAAVHALTAAADGFHGTVTAPGQAAPAPLRVRMRRGDGTEAVVQHRYRLRVPGEGVVQRMAGTGATRLRAVAVAPEGFIWAGGDQGATVYRVSPGATTALRVGQLFPDNPAGRVEEVVVDQLGRVHFLTFAQGTAAFPADHRAVVLAQGTFCPTVNIADPHQAYPFQVRDLATGALKPSPSTRAVAAGGGNIWLLGSDGGVARVADTFREGSCPADGVAVHYESLFRRDTHEIPANTVPALVVGADGTLWFGTALGLARFQGGQFTPVPFAPGLFVQGDPQTLEAFFQAVADAIAQARPIATVASGGVSFVEAFGGPLTKEDLIFSAVAAGQGQLWVGTFGGGLRRIDGSGGLPRDTQHLTRQDGLGSNLIFALAVGPDGALWTATDEGVSRLQEVAGQVVLTTFSALEGLALPARDIAVDAEGTAWVATDGGLFRIGGQGAQVQGVVRDTAGRPVMGADVGVPGTPFRTVTDAEGQFVLANLPPGLPQLRVDGQLATGGPFTSACADLGAPGRGQHLEETIDAQPVEPIALAPLAVAGPLQLVQISEIGPTGRVGSHLPLAVAVVDAQGQPVAGLPVTFTVLDGPGTVSAACVPTDTTGQAATTLTVTEAGAIRVEASVAGLAVFLAATGEREEGMARLRIVSGNNQVVAPGTILPEPLVVRLEDQFGTPLPGEAVMAEIIEGEAVFLSAEQVETDAQGEARFVLRAGEQEGTIVTRVSALEQEVQFQALIVALANPVAIAVEADGSLVVADDGVRAVVRVSPGTGDVTLVSGLGRGTGPPLGFLQGIAVEPDGTLVVADSGTVVRVHPDTGDRTVLSGCAARDPETFSCTALRGAGPPLVVSRGIAVEPDGALVLTDAGNVLRVHPDTGDRTVLSGCPAFDFETFSCTAPIIGTGPPLDFPSGIAVAPDGTLVVADSESVVRVHPDTGDRTVLSGCPAFDRETFSCTAPIIGAGPPLVVSRGIAVEPNGTLVVVDIVGVVRVHPDTGDRTVLSGCAAFGRDLFSSCAALFGAGPLLISPEGIAVEPDGALVVADAGISLVGVAGVVVRVHPDTGDRTVLSEGRNNRIGTGPPLDVPEGIAVEPNGALVVADRRAGTVVRVDPDTGDRTVLSGCAARDPETLSCTTLLGAGPPLLPLGIAVEPNGTLVVANGGPFGLLRPAGAVVRVHPDTGDRTVLSGCAAFDPETFSCTALRGAGPPLILPEGIAVEPDGTLVVADRGLIAVVRVHPDTGDRTVLSGCAARDPETFPCTAPLGTGPPLDFLTDIAVEPDGALVVADAGVITSLIGAVVLRVHPDTGDRTVLSGCAARDPETFSCTAPRGAGPPLIFPEGIAVEPDGALVVADRRAGTVVRVNPVTGDSALISHFDRVTNMNIGNGPLLVSPGDIAIEADGSLIVVDTTLRAVVRVDPLTGDRTILSR